MTYRLVWTKGAIKRLQAIYNYLAEHASPQIADKRECGQKRLVKAFRV